MDGVYTRIMQRLIAASLIVLVLLVGGAGFGYWTYKQNCPHPIYVPLPVTPETSAAKRAELAASLKAKLSEPELLLKVCKEVGLKAKWQLASDAQAVAELRRRLLVQASETTIDVGVHGKKKDKAVSGEIVTRLMEEVRKIIGLPAPP